jgi:hypothetical protein
LTLTAGATLICTSCSNGCKPRGSIAELTIDTGTVVLDGALVRGKEPDLRLSGGDEYAISIYASVTSARLKRAA